MAEFSKLNGYDVKDAVARQNILAMSEFLNTGLPTSYFKVFPSLDYVKNHLDEIGVSNYVMTLGYLINGDNGGAKYLVTPIIGGEVFDNGSKIKLNDELYLLRIHDSNVVNVCSFGILSDRVNQYDYVTRLQEAIDYTYNISNSGGTLYFPNGYYYISLVDTSINLPRTDTTRKMLSIIGESVDGTIIYVSLTGSQKYLFKSIGEETNPINQNIVFNNFTISHDALEKFYPFSFKNINGNVPILKDIKIDMGSYDDSNTLFLSCKNCSVENVIFYAQSDPSYSTIMMIANSSNLSFNKCYFLGFIRCDGYTKYLRFTNCTFTGGLLSYENTILDNVIIEKGNVQCLGHGNATNVTLLGNPADQNSRLLTITNCGSAINVLWVPDGTPTSLYAPITISQGSQLINFKIDDTNVTPSSPSNTFGIIDIGGSDNYLENIQVSSKNSVGINMSGQRNTIRNVYVTNEAYPTRYTINCMFTDNASNYIELQNHNYIVGGATNTIVKYLTGNEE